MTAPTILVVEDNPLARKVTRVALESAGYLVDEAPDARTALAYVARAAPDLILQDIKLPDMNGVELISRLRGLSNARAVPIVAVTGYRSELEYARSAMAGFSEILFKPIEPSVLVRVVRAHLRPAPGAGDQTGTPRRLVLVDDDPVQLKLAALHLAAAGFEVRTAGDGVAGLELARGWTPDIVVSDVLMPRLDGFRVCASLKGDAVLRHVPVVLASSAFLAPEDTRLASEMGAECLVARTPDCREILGAVQEAIDTPRQPPATVPDPRLSADYVERICHQLERQVQINGSLAQRLAQRRAEIAVLSAAAEAITAGHTSASLQEVLQQAFNACGVAHGAAYLLDANGALTLHAVMGYEEASRGAIAQFFGRPALLSDAAAGAEPRIVAGMPGGLGTVIVAPLRLATACLGVFWMEVDEADASPTEWLPFAVAVGSQLAQAVALSRAYAEAAAGREASRREALRRQQLQIKDEFLSHVSHELRTPLTAIHQFVSILLDGLAGPVGADQREYLTIALRNANELRAMIDGLLEATRSETARLSIEPRAVALPEVIRDVLTSLEPSARQKGVAITVDPPGGLPSAYADPARVGQILSNLVGNAIKFTPEGGSVAVRVQVAPDDRAMLRVSVADTGPGIAVEERERIFDYLYQGQSAAGLARKGFGIGLHLCRELVTRQGGRIWADSEPGHGSVFHFTLPMRHTAASHVA